MTLNDIGVIFYYWKAYQ